jgi:glycosyltransferase involved in cell wall biosynthesis
MKILFDHQIFESQKFGGVSKYFDQLFDNFDASEELKYELAIFYSNNGYLAEREGMHYHTLPNRPASYNHNQSNQHNLIRRYVDRYFYLNKLEKCHQKNIQHSIQKIHAQDYDVFHPTFYDEYFLKHLQNKPYVLTVHDLTHQIYPEYFSPGWIDKSSDVIHQASRLIAVSENTKKDLIDFYEVDPHKIDVIHLASSITKTNQDHYPGMHLVQVERYLLFVGSRETYKNFYFFVRAIVPLLRQDKDLHLICTGAAFNEQEQLYFSKLGIADRVKQVYVTEEDLPFLYTNAAAFIFPSLYEGFGLPILEAFACGCPVICSQASSFPEIAGNAALYFEPKNKQSIYGSIYRILNDQTLRSQMIAAGYEQLKKFSWLNTFNQTKSVYHKALEA